MKTINIEIKGKKATPEEVKESIDYMLKELGEDGLCHLVGAYQNSNTIQGLVKTEIASRKAAKTVTKVANGGKKLASGLMNRIKKK